MMNIAIIGTGYVGLVTGTCLASQGMHVSCCDTDKGKIQKLINGIMPIYEPGLEKLVKECSENGNLEFFSDVEKVVENSLIIFITVNTPTLEHGECDLTNVFSAAKSIASAMDSYKIIVNKSTVPVGTARKVRNIIRQELERLGKNVDFDIVSNPEFLREGSAVNDFIRSDRIVIGAENSKAADQMKEVYKEQIQNGVPVLITDPQTAEMIKYASNAFLASKISFINEIAAICEHCGADIALVAKGMGLDRRIGEQFLRPGPGFGGSCFPKDVKALSWIARQYGLRSVLLNSILEANTLQIKRMTEKIENAAGEDLAGKTVTFLGLSFKPGTDDIRESPAVQIIKDILEKKAIVKAYDPAAMERLKKERPELDICYCGDISSACEGSDCIVLATEWEEFNGLDFDKLKQLVKTPVFLDMRNVYTPSYVKSFGFHYEGVGRC